MKVSYADERTGELDSLTKQERWFGLLLGIGGTMLTLLIGGTATTVIEFLLSLGLKLQLVPPSKFGIPFTIFGRALVDHRWCLGWVPVRLRPHAGVFQRVLEISADTSTSSIDGLLGRALCRLRAVPRMLETGSSDARSVVGAFSRPPKQTPAPFGDWRFVLSPLRRRHQE